MLCIKKYKPFDLLDPSAFFILFYIFYLLASPTAYLLGSLYGTENDVPVFSNKAYQYALLYLIIFYVASYILAPSIFSLSESSINASKFSVHIDRFWKGAGKIFFTSIILAIISLSIYSYYFISINSIPIFRDDVATFRSSAKSGFGAFILISNALALFYSISVGLAYRYISSVKKIFTLVVLNFLVLAIVGTGFRGPAAYLYVAFAVSYLSLDRRFILNKSIPLALFIFAFVLLIIISVLGVYRNGGDVTLASLLSVFWVMTVNFINFDMLVSYIDVEGVYYGKTFVDDFLVGVPGFGGEFLGVKLKSLIGVEFEGQGMTVTAPGEAYANFGILGLVIIPITMGIGFRVISAVMTSSISIRSRIFYVFLCLSLPKIVTSGVMPPLIFSIIPGVFVFATLFFLLEIFRMYKLKRIN